MRFEENLHTPDLQHSAILLVEDDESDLLLLRRAFRNARIANPLVEVRDGQAAIQYLSGDGEFTDRTHYPLPFLILLDLRMPKLSGFEVLAWIRDQPELADLIIVVLTSSKVAIELMESYRLGVNSYVIKPEDPAKFAELIAEISNYWLTINEPPPS